MMKAKRNIFLNKRFFVLWSGGLDSTYLIYYLLQSGAKVEAGYVEILNNREKVRREKRAIEKLVKVFRSHWNEDHFQYQGVLLSTFVKMAAPVVSLVQVPIWIIGLIMSGLGKRHYYKDYVALGYVMGDDAISFLPEITRIYKAYEGISHNRFPQLVFPLSKKSKMEFYDNLPKEYLEKITFCEGSKELCGECSSCKKWKQAEEAGGIPDYAFRFTKPKIPNLKRKKLKSAKILKGH